MKLPLLLAGIMSITLFAGDVPVEGNPKSAVRVVVYEDLQCPDCAVYRRMLDETLLPRFGGKVAFEHRDFPLPKHKWAREAAIAGRFFDRVKPELGTKWRRFALENLRAITVDNFRDKLSEFAKLNGADEAKAVAALTDTALAKLVDDDYQEGVARGIARTPTVLVNDQPFIETFPVGDVVKAIESALGGAK